MIGTTLSHYRIVEQIGAGGMGVVYRAHDERLERDVAVKVLPPGTCDQDVRRRFQREALALSRLNHPNIATIHDFDAAGDVDFLVMELVAGPTLGDLLKTGALPEDRIVRLGVQIAEALEAAHERGVLHRDLKPGNIVVTARDNVKVLDFGLARLLETGPDSLAATVSGATTHAMVGTPSYMAPEVLKDQTVDERTDLYALGVVLFEMATGRVPFQQRVAAALILDITQQAPPSPRSLRPDLSPTLERVILRALEKDPARRFSSAAEMADALRGAAGTPGSSTRAFAGAAGVPAIASLAVLPLENLSGDPEQEFFADGMTDTLIADLAQIGALRVISRTSAMQYKGARRPLPQIARELNVDAVVEGTVLRSGDRVRIHARLIDAASERPLWSARYERSVGDVLTLQGAVARAIADEVRVQLTPQEAGRLGRQRVVRPEAFEAYMRGRHFWNKRIQTDVRRSIEFFQRAIELDPGYALAYSGLADSWNILGDYRVVRQTDAFSRARAAATRALELDPVLGEPHTSLGFVKMFHEFDWEGAAAEFEQALALSPGYATGHQWYAEFLASQGRFEQAIAEARRAEQIDPLSAVIGATVSDVFYFARRYDEAIAQLQRIAELEPTFLLIHPDLGRAFAQVGRFDEALEEYRRATELAGGLPGSSAGLVYSLAIAGRHAEALALLPDLEARARAGRMNPYAIATVYTGLGDADRAFEWLERAYEEHDGGLVWIHAHPRMDPLRGDPRFGDLLRRMRFGA